MYYRHIMAKFLITLEQDEAGWYVAECPDLPGCVSQGRSREEAIRNIREAIAASLETRVARGEILPRHEVVEVEVPAGPG
jgi:predicted RNase H-like HicB family nuclease